MEAQQQVFETGATLFSNSSFIWRKLNIGRRDSTADDTGESITRGGAFYYQGTGQISSACRNRAILWRHNNHGVHLLEMSLDHDIVNNAVHILVSPSLYGNIAGDVTIHELSSHVVMLFQTLSHVFRLVLPHPDIVAKDSKLFAAGKGLHPSILSFAREDSFSGINTVAAFPSGMDQSTLGISCCGSWIGMDGVAMFFYGLSSNNSIHCVQIPSPGSSVVPERFEMNDRSVVKKIWNLLPTGIRGSSDDGFQPVGLTQHSFGGEIVLLVLCRNGTLKLWSIQQRDCIMEHSLLQYLPSNTSLDNAKITIHKSHTTSIDSLNFAVYFGHPTLPQLSIFQLLLIDSQLVLDLVTSHSLQEGQSFVELSLLADEWWMVSSVEETPIVTYCCYGDRLNPVVNKVSMRPFPLPEVVVGDIKDARETYLDAIFGVDNFSSEAIIRALKLYGSSLTEGNSINKLRTEVIQRIEEEITSWSCDMSSDEYWELLIKCWNKFYTCCLQYDKLVRTPVGVSCDPATGMVTVIQEGAVSFIHPRRSAVSSEDGSEEGVSQARKYLHDNLSEEVLRMFMIELCYTDPMILIARLVESIVQGDQSSTFVNGLLQILSEVNIAGFSNILYTLGPSEDPPESDGNNNEGAAPGIDLAVADLFSSPVSTRLMGGAITDWSHDTIEMCRDVLIMLSVMKRFSACTNISIGELSGLVSSFSDLLTNCHILNWLCTTVTTPTNQTIIDANLKMLSSLRITEHVPMNYTMKRNTPNTTVMELFISAHGRGIVMRKLLELSPFKPNVPVFAYWRNLLPWILDQLIKNCWPITMFLSLYQLLLTEGQYLTLQELHSKLRPLVESLDSNDDSCMMVNSSLFLLGQSYISSGESGKGCQCFIEASQGRETEPLLMRVSENDGGYWTVCMRLLEDAGATEGVVQLLEHATKLLDEDDVMPLLWSNLFKYSLDLQLHQKAYYAMVNNPDAEKREECLKHFVVILTERMQMKELCSFTYCGMEEKVEHVMELRARSVDVSDVYYDLMYCYHISREKYWKAAHVMFECGFRYGLEGKSFEHVQQECNCYATCLNCLKMVSPQYHWIVLPVEQNNLQSNDKDSPVTDVKILKLRDIEVKFELVQSKVILLKQFPSLVSQLCNPYVSCEEVQTLFCQNGMYDDALRLSVNCSLSLVPVFESLATKCAVLNFNTLSLRDDHTLWAWLSYNDQYCDTATAESRSSNIVDQAWGILHTYLLRYPGDYQLLKAVTRKLLSLGCNLQQWLIDLVKLTNPDGLLRLYLQYNLLPQAIGLLIEYIDALMGPGREQFGIKNTLHVSHPPVWLPYTTIDQLMCILDKDHSDDANLDQLKENLELKMDEYTNLLERSCDQTKQSYLLL